MVRRSPRRSNRSKSALFARRRPLSRPKRLALFAPRLEPDAATATGTPPAQDFAPTRGAAADEKSVAARTPRLGRLIRSPRRHRRPIRKRAVLEPVHQGVVNCSRRVARIAAPLWISQGE